MMAATWRPLPQPVPSPSIQPRRNRTGSDRVSPSWVTREVSTSSSLPSSSSLRRWTVSHWEPMRYSAARWRECASPANTTLSSWASDSRPSVTMRSGSIGRYAGTGCGTAAMAADCTSGVGCSTARGTRTAPGRHGAYGPASLAGASASAAGSTGPVSTTNSEIGPQSWERRVSGVDTGLGPRRVAGFGATGLPNRSRAGPAGTGAGAMSCRFGICAMTASSSSAAFAAQAVPSNSTRGPAPRSSTVRRVSKPVPRRA